MRHVTAAEAAQESPGWLWQSSERHGSYERSLRHFSAGLVEACIALACGWFTVPVVGVSAANSGAARARQRQVTTELPKVVRVMYLVSQSECPAGNRLGLPMPDPWG